MDSALEVRVASGPDEFTELFLAGLSLREIAYIFRARFRHGYMVVLDVDSGTFLGDDFAETLEQEGLLCEQLDEDGEIFLLRTDTFDLVADLKPFRLSLMFIDGPVTAEDFRRAGGSRDVYPDKLETFKKLGGKLFLYYRADHYMMISAKEDWFPRDILEYFFEKSFLDNERMLRPEELDGLLHDLYPTISESGLFVAPPPEGDLESPIKAIGWVAPDGLGGSKAYVNGKVPCFCIRRESSGIEVAMDGKVTLIEFFGSARFMSLWLASMRPTFAPILLGLLVFCLLQVLGQSPSSTSAPFLELMLVILLIQLMNSR